MIVYPLPVKLRFYWPMSSNLGLSAILRIYLRFDVISALRISFHFSGISAVLRKQIHLDEFSTFMYFYHISLKSHLAEGIISGEIDFSSKSVVDKGILLILQLTN